MVQGMESGHFDPETGNFTGIVGELVKNRGDVCFQGTRLAGLVDQLRLATVTNNIYLHALVSNGNITNRYSDIMEVFTEVSGICYLGFAIMCLKMMIVVAMHESLALKISLGARIFYGKMAEALWSLVRTIVDQECFLVKSWSSKIGWWMMCVAIFIAMQGYIFNLVKTDITVQIKPKVIDRIEDFYEPEFEHVVPGIFTTFWFLDRLITENPGNHLGKLYRKRMLKVHREQECRRDGDDDFSRCPIIDLNVYSSSYNNDIRNYFKQIANGQKALLTESVVYGAIKESDCALEPRIIQGIRLSETSFATDTLSLVMRSDLPMAFRTYDEYRTRSYYLEAGFQQPLVYKALREEFMAKFGDRYDWKFEKCLVDIFDESTNDVHDLIQLPLKSLQTLNDITLKSFAVSILLLIGEISHWFIWKFCKKVNGRKRTKSKPRWVRVEPKVFYISKRNVIVNRKSRCNRVQPKVCRLSKPDLMA